MENYREQEKRWKLIQDMLAAEASGKELRPAISQRTLFGIPSTVEQVIERTVREDEKERRMKRERARNGQVERVEHPLEPVFDQRSRVLLPALRATSSPTRSRRCSTHMLRPRFGISCSTGKSIPAPASCSSPIRQPYALVSPPASSP